MKMPTTTNVKVEAKVSPEVGDAAKQCINCLEKKVRNLEKRKTRIEQNQEKAKKGSKLEKEQEVSLQQYEQVNHDLEFAKELHKQFQQIYTEHEKMAKKQAKREKAERQAQEIKKVSEILQLQSLLDLLGGDKVREDFKTGKHGAVVLSEDNLNHLDELYQVISPSREESGYSQRLTTAAEHLVAILDGKDRQVMGTTYKEIKELITLISGCGYFDKLSEPEPAEEPKAAEEEEEEDETPAPETETVTTEEDQEEDTPEKEEEEEPTAQPGHQPIDLTIGTTEMTPTQEEAPAQHMNTLEQDAFFGPSSTAYQVEPEPQFAQQSLNQAPASAPREQATDFQSFTTNRPFQFIQTSYIMPEVAADPAVIAAQPAGASGLQFMSQSFESSQQVSQQPQKQLQQPELSHTGQSAGQPAKPQQSSQDFSSQSYAQAGLPQADSRYKPGSVEEVASSLSTRGTTAAAGMIAPMGEGAVLGSHSPYEIPPSIPMPPSQLQDQNHLDQQTQQQHQEKKFQMNASAPAFQSMYASVSSGPGAGMSVPPPAVPPSGVQGQDQTGMPADFSSVQGSMPAVPSTQSNGDFGPQSGAGDFQQVYQGNGFNGGSFNRGGRGGFRGGRGGSGGNGAHRNGGMQNGFNNRGAGSNSGRGGRGNYQGYPPNSGYRPDGYQGGFNAGAQAGGFGNQVFSKRGGGMGGGGNQGGGQGYNRGGGGNMGRGGAGGMRGGMPRGGGQGAPRGAPRGGFNRPTPAQ